MCSRAAEYMDAARRISREREKVSVCGALLTAASGIFGIVHNVCVCLFVLLCVVSVHS